MLDALELLFKDVMSKKRLTIYEVAQILSEPFVSACDSG